MVSLDDLRSGVSGRILAAALIVLIAAANLAFVATVVLPRWQNYEQLVSHIEVGQNILASREVENAGEISVLQAQVERAEAGLISAAYEMLTPAQVDKMIDRLYWYARNHGVEITHFQAQQPPFSSGSSHYEVQAFRLQIEGQMHSLLKTISAIQEAAHPAIHLDSITAVPIPSGTTALTLNIVMHTSTFASNDLFTLPLPEEPATPIPQPAKVRTDTVKFPLQDTQDTPPLPAVDCPGAPTTLFRVGDTVVVDFNEIGALRILKHPSSMESLTQVYDGAQLRLLDGPICGVWRGEKILYWYVNHDGLQGWVGEGDAKDRWLCPLSDPDCS